MLPDEPLRKSPRGPAPGILALGAALLIGIGAAPLCAVSLGVPLAGAWLVFTGAAAAGGLVLRAALVARGRQETTLLETLARAAGGDVAARLDPRRLGDLAELGLALNRLQESRRELHHDFRAVRERLAAVPAELERMLSALGSGVEEQAEASQEVAGRLETLQQSILGIDQQIESLNRATEETSSSILEMGSSVEEVARNTAALHQTVEGSTASLQEMGASVRQTTDSSDSVQSMAQESAAAMVEMTHSIQEVEEHVVEAARLTEQVASEAGEGSREVIATIEGIQEIRTLSGQARQVFERLNGRIGEITEIIHVIGGINDETNLLSLNAAIIAAQAGEQGKAFAVVANRVKTLAERTASSTREISRLIHAVQEESGNALTAMSAGLGAVETGVARSRRAGDALDRIRSSAEKANTRVTEIQRATSEQARNSKHVTEAAQRTSLMVQQIHQAMGEQSKASEQMLRNAELALEACRHVHRSVEEQRSSGRFISESVSSIAEMITRVHENTAAHAKGSAAMSEAMSRMLEVTQRQSHRIPELEAVARRLAGDRGAVPVQASRAPSTAAPIPAR